LLALGPEALSDVELIALQLRSGARGESAVDLACQLLARFGDTARLAEATVDELAAAPAIGVAKAASLVACFQLARRSHAQREQPGLVLRNAADVATVARVELAGLRRERVIVLVCNGQNRLIRVVKVSDGSIDRSLVGVREVLNAVLVNDGKAFAVAHNHPGGDARPSESDIAVTAQVAIASKTVGLRFLGHVAVADDDWSEIPLRPCPRTPD
jgi:DNA repair protein RadC